MQKRSLVIFSLFLISVLLVSGCNQAVGGNVGSSGSRTRDPAYSGVTTNVIPTSGCMISVANGNSIIPDLQPVSVGSYVLDEESGACFTIITCGDVILNGNQPGIHGEKLERSVASFVVMGIVPVSIPCHQNGGVITIHSGQHLSNVALAGRQ